MSRSVNCQGLLQFIFQAGGSHEEGHKSFGHKAWLQHFNGC